MEESRKTLAIVLNRQDYREYDSLVSLYTLDYGKLTLMAKGTKRPKSKLAGHLEPISLIDLMIIPGKGRDYAGGAINREVFHNLKADLNRLYYAGASFRLFKRLISENEADESLFYLLLNYLHLLDSFAGAELAKEDGELLFVFFAFKFFMETGYKPQINNCSICGNKIIPGKNYFNLHLGGLICESCFLQKKGGETRELLTISDNCIKLLRFILENNLDLSKKLKIDKKLIKEISALVKGFTEFRS